MNRATRTLVQALCLSTAITAAPAFTSIYTGTDSCRDAFEVEDDHGGDMPAVCPGAKGYRLYETYSAVQTYRIIESTTDSFSVALEPEAPHDYYSFGALIEWRLAGTEPFAVIHRVQVFRGGPDDHGHYFAAEFFAGEYLLVRGLGVCDGLAADIDCRSVSNANERARAVADSCYAASSTREGQP